MRGGLLAALAIAGCGTSAPTDSQPAQLDHLRYDAPLAWTSSDSSGPGGPSTTWTPEDNGHKESLIVRRSHFEPGRREPDLATLRGLVMSAQHLLPGATIGNVEPIVTDGGLRGVSVVTSFIPRAQTSRYFRKHAVLLDGDAYIHVIYTAQTPDAHSVDEVVRSLRKEG